MISIDTVYQRVLAIINKENRGYLTPQDFNLFANQAQLEIFEQYFFDLNQYGRIKENNTEYANLYKIIEEKLSKFKKEANLTYSTDYFQLPSDFHKLGTVIYNNTVEVEKVDRKQLMDYQGSKLTQPDTLNPLYIQNATSSSNNWGLKIYPTTINANISCTYVRKPVAVEWAYTNVAGTALYNASNSTNFELHESEEVGLVFKILLYAGLNIKEADVIQIADAKETKKITQEKS
jgi:hypothetical protein